MPAVGGAVLTRAVGLRARALRRAQRGKSGKKWKIGVNSVFRGTGLAWSADAPVLS